jgi:hypothetical protein
VQQCSAGSAQLAAPHRIDPRFPPGPPSSPPPPSLVTSGGPASSCPPEEPDEEEDDEGELSLEPHAKAKPTIASAATSTDT